jgi:hypothetical protein
VEGGGGRGCGGFWLNQNERRWHRYLILVPRLLSSDKSKSWPAKSPNPELGAPKYSRRTTVTSWNYCLGRFYRGKYNVKCEIVNTAERECVILAEDKLIR